MNAINNLIPWNSGVSQGSCECNYADNYYGDQVCVTRRNS